MRDIFKVWGLSLGSVSVSTLDIQEVLQTIVVILSIIYTMYKMYLANKDK